MNREEAKLEATETQEAGRINGIPLSVQILLNMVPSYQVELVNLSSPYRQTDLSPQEQMTLLVLLKSISFKKIFRMNTSYEFEIEQIVDPKCLFVNLVSNKRTQSSIHRLIKHKADLFVEDDKKKAINFRLLFTDWTKLKMKFTQVYEDRFPFLEQTL